MPHEDILKTINEYIVRLNENDNFLIYYAGHGYYDETLDQSVSLQLKLIKRTILNGFPQQSK